MGIFAALAPIIGSVAGGLMSKSGNKSSSTTSNEPWSGVQPYLTDLYAGASNLAQSQMGQMPGVPQLAASMPYAQYFPFATSTAYNPDPRTLQGLEMGLNYADNYLPSLINQQYGGYGSLMGAANVAQNPYVNQMLGQQVGANTEAFGQNVGRFQDAFGSSLSDIGDTLKRDWLQSIGSGSSLANQYGGTRQGVAEGVAMGDATKALTSAVKTGMLGLSDYGTNAARALSSNLANTQMGAYGQGLNAMTNAMQMAPSIAQLGMLPSQMYQQTGGALDALRQQQINAEKQRWDYEQNAQINQMKDAEQRALTNYGLQVQGMQNQWYPLQQMSGIYSGFPTSSTSTAQGPSNWVNGAVGGAMLGSSLYNQYFNSPAQQMANYATSPNNILNQMNYGSAGWQAQDFFNPV